MLKKFKDNHIPISVFLLGDKWHNNIENYSYDRTLFDTNIIKKYYGSPNLTLEENKIIGENDFELL